MIYTSSITRWFWVDRMPTERTPCLVHSVSETVRPVRAAFVEEWTRVALDPARFKLYGSEGDKAVCVELVDDPQMPAVDAGAVMFDAWGVGNDDGYVFFRFVEWADVDALPELTPLIPVSVIEAAAAPDPYGFRDDAAALADWVKAHSRDLDEAMSAWGRASLAAMRKGARK